MKDKKFWLSVLAGIMAGVLLLSLVLSLLPSFAHAAQTSDEIKSQIEQMKKENSATQAELDALKKQMSALQGEQDANLTEISAIVAEKALIDQQVGLLYAQVTNMNEQIAAYNVLIADKQEELDEAQARLEELNEKYKERIRAMEEDGNISYWSVLLEANSFFDLLDRLNMVQEIAEADNRRLEQLRQAAQEVETAREAMLAEREELNAAKAELEATQSELLLKGAESQELLNLLTAKMEELQQQEDAYAELMDEMEDELSELEVSIGKAEIELDKALYQEYLATLTTVPPTTKAPTYSSGSNVGAGKAGTVVVDESGIEWVVPCDYKKVSSAYGWRIHPVHKDYRFHHGVDLSAKCLMKKDGSTDSPILATRAGVVIISGWSNSAGWYVTIDHLDGYKSTYMHMCCKPAVKVGQAVAAGQYLGCIGTTGTSTGDHLHFGIYKYNTKKKDWESVNPMDYIG